MRDSVDELGIIGNTAHGWRGRQSIFLPPVVPAELGGKRAFQTDYEIYDRRSANPKQAQVEIHIGLKPGNN